MTTNRSAVAILVVTASLLLSACSTSTPPPAAPATSSDAAVLDASSLLQSDGAGSDQLAEYATVLAKLGTSCAEGPTVSFSVDATAKAASMSRLQLMQTVAAALGSSANVDCTSAVLAAASGAPIVTSSDAGTAVSYLLGDESTTRLPAPDCSLAVGAWTASTGAMVVNVTDVRGPTSLHVAVTKKSGAVVVQDGLILGGQSAHDFKFSDVDPSAVTNVLVTATSNDDSVGGSCVATGSPTA
ncbi:hypothetical protein QN345_03530 [Cryobacterium sp. 10I1]|uniref:hypothetical protein n=1 Tax=unclassified Cryobacterium TaxID=2649013 RepID=UPI002AB59556|nr:MULTISPECIES: hypothetical protein [unclassified Cryobacterium]MDY7540863.1 hypothetical protein [Cryobacterium sp. 5B3]MEA9999827.1 hypothetical protein [Cryobacterium sp. RTS3]MEB0003842.1 hypothetical protein [Cryobacterium sp. RTC2.1]MEB0201287.1 hypothetical protein [Cryobacterium sp. 5I3]MEB0266614.1 hypothetical protein [Cryobacterium sp. 10I5]